MKPLKSLAGQTVVYGLPSIVGRILNYLLVPLYTRAFSTADYGTITSLYAAMSFLNIVLTYGMETSLFNFSRQQEDKQKVFSTILTSVTCTSFIFLALAYVFRNSIAVFVKDPAPADIMWVALILCTDAISSIAFAKLREMNKARVFAVIKTINILSNIVFNIFFIIICPKVLKQPDSAFAGFVRHIYNPDIGAGYVFISQVLSSGLTLVMLLPGMIKAGMNFDGALLRRILPYALPLLLAGFAGMINETLDRFILLYLIKPEQVAREQIGIYGACYKISIIITMFVQAFKYAAEPFFFSNAKDPDFKKIYAEITKYFIIICLFIFLGTMFNLSWIQYFVGKNFRSGLKVVPILLMANLCLGVFYNLSMWYKLAHKTIFGAYLTIFGAIITIVINVVFVPVYGYMASAWATLICYASQMVVSYLLSNKYFPVQFEMPRIGLYFGVSLALYFISEQMHLNSNMMTLILNNGMILVFAAIVFFIERPSFAVLKKK